MTSRFQKMRPSRLLPFVATLLSLLLPSTSSAFIRRDLSPDASFLAAETCRNVPVDPDMKDPTGEAPVLVQANPKDPTSVRWADTYDIKMLGWERAVARGETVDRGLAMMFPLSRQPIDMLKGESIEQVCGEGVGRFADASVRAGAMGVGILIAPINHAYRNYELSGGGFVGGLDAANRTLNPAFYLMAHGNALFTGKGVEWFNSGEQLDAFSRGVNGAFMVVDATALFSSAAVGATRSYAGLSQWTLKGVENDQYYFALNAAERELYRRGQKTLSIGFWKANEATLGGFTAGKEGAEYVAGVVARGRWLKENYPIRSFPLNPYETAMGMPATIGSGPTPELRRPLMILLRLEKQ